MTTTNFMELAGIELTDLSGRGKWKVAEAITTPESVLLDLVDNGWVLEGVASNRSASAKVLNAVWAKKDELRDYEQYGIVEQIAKNPNTPTEITDILTDHQYAAIRKSAYGHRNTSLDLVERAAKYYGGIVGKAAVKELARRTASTK